MKTAFTIILSIFTLMTISAYPFQPKQLLMVEFAVIGFSSLMLALEPNFKITTGSYLETVLRKSIPNAITMLIPVVLVQIIGKDATYTQDAVSAIATLTITLSAYLNLFFLCRPYTKWRRFVVIISGIIMLSITFITIFLLNDMLGLTAAFTAPGLFSYGMGLVVALSLFIHLGTGRFKFKDMRR